MSQHLKSIILVGRPNVGKSTLFNRLIGQRLAIEHHEAHTTRDANLGVVNFDKQRAVQIIDTAGDEAKIRHELIQQAKAKRENWVQQADHILLMVNAQELLTSEDQRIIRDIRKQNRSFSVVVAKCDNHKLLQQAQAEFNQLGGDIFYLSALHNLGVDNLKAYLEQFAQAYSQPPALKVAILGRPNAGKSTLMNTLVGSEVSIVSNLPGTTRDIITYDLPFASVITNQTELIRLFDTAGLTRRGKAMWGLSRYSTLRIKELLGLIDCVLLCLDSTQPLAAQDAKLAQLALEENLSIILVVTKWDLVVDPKDSDVKQQEAWLSQLQSKFRFIPWVPVVFVSSLQSRRLNALKNQLVKVRLARNITINPQELEQLKLELIKDDNLIGLQNLVQIDTNPPRFRLELAKKIPALARNKVRYLAHKVRRLLDLGPTPLIITQPADRVRGQKPLPDLKETV